MPTAYIFVPSLGSEENIISKVPDIKEVRGTYGVYDVFVKIISDFIEEMNHTIKNKISLTNSTLRRYWISYFNQQKPISMKFLKNPI